MPTNIDRSREVMQATASVEKPKDISPTWLRPMTWVPPKDRVYLVLRYSRTECGRVVFYGRNHVELNFDSLVERLHLLAWNRARESICMALKWIGHSELLESDPTRTKLRLVEEQLERVVALWSELLNLLKSGDYVPRGRDGRKGYCTNTIDVLLLDALDTLYALDESSATLVPAYVPIFTVPYTDPECKCITCHPSEELVIFCLRGAILYHWTVKQKVFKRVFAELGSNIPSGA